MEEEPRTAEDFEATLTDQDRRRIQAALQEIGLYRAPIDGVFGPRTREAITIFQRSRGLPATGLLSCVAERGFVQGIRDVTWSRR